MAQKLITGFPRNTYLDFQLIVLKYENSGLDLFNSNLWSIGNFERLDIKQVAFTASNTGLEDRHFSTCSFCSRDLRFYYGGMLPES